MFNLLEELLLLNIHEKKEQYPFMPLQKLTFVLPEPFLWSWDNKMTRRLIGIVPLYDDNKESYWMLPGYMKGIEEAGEIPVMLPLTTPILK